MLNLSQISLSLYGENFSPSKINKKIRFENKNEVGEIGTVGRYKGKPIPYGSASIYVEKKFPIEENKDDDLIPDDFIKVVEDNIDSFKSAGATNIELRLSIFWKDQCNFDFSAALIRRIASLNIPFLVSCYEDDD